MMLTTWSWWFEEKREALSKFLPQGRQDPRDFKPDSAKPLFLDHEEVMIKMAHHVKFPT